MVRHRKVLPKAAYHLAIIIATQAEDCGECLEMAVRSAQRDGVPAHYLRAAITANYHLLPEALQDVCAFAKSVCEGADDADLRDALRNRYGAKGLVELGFVIAGSRLFPTVKRVLGRATACSATPLALPV